MTTPSTMAPRAWAMLLLLAVLWGGSFFAVAIAVREWPPLSIVLARVAIAAAVLLAAAWAFGVRLRTDRAALRVTLGMAVLNSAVPFALIVWAQSSVTSSLASIVNASTPLWAVLVMHVAGLERAAPVRLAGAAIGFLAIGVMLGSGATTTSPWPVLALFGAAVSYAVGSLWNRRAALLGIPPVAGAAGQTLLASLLLLPAVLLFEPPWTLPPPSAALLASLASLGVLSTALAYLLFFRVLAIAGPVNALLVTLLVPITAVLLGALVLGEPLGFRHGIGLAGVALGIALIDGRLPRTLVAHARGSRQSPPRRSVQGE